MKTMKEILNNRPPLPADLEEKILQYGMPWSGYLFTRKESRFDPITGAKEKVTECYCTACKSYSWMEYTPNHGEWETCPNCGSHFQALKWNVSRMYRQDRCNYAIIQPSGENVYIRFFEVERDYSVPPEKVRTDIQEVECFFFSKGRPRRFSRYWYSYMASYLTKDWSEIQCSQERLTDYKFYPSPADVMEGTVLQHCHMNDYIRLCEKRRVVCKPVKYLITYARHPGIEHLMGAGLDRLVYQLVNGANGLGLVNWKGRRPRDMLGLTEPEVKTAAKNGYTIHDIDMWKKLKPGGISLEDSQTITAFVTLTGDRLEHVKKIGFPESAKYLKHVVEKDKFFTLHNAAQYWVDAWKMAKNLGYDMTVAEYRFPPKLRSFHDRLVELDQQRQLMEEEKKRAAEAPLWEEQYQRLSPLAWEKEGLLIRPVRTWRELVDEGAKLSHCVGSYADRVKRGDTLIFFIRKADAPDVSYYTLNLSPEGRFIQCHGYANDRYTPIPENVRKFWEEWMETVCRKFFKKAKKAAEPAA